MLKICRKIRQLILKMKRLHISRDELFRLKPFPNRPYELEHSEPFLKATKKNDLKSVKSLLWISKLLVHSFDWSNFTALHWAAKRGYSEMCYFLVKNGADLEAEDALDRTPLWYAIHTSNIDCVFRLLSLGAALPKKLQFSKLQTSKVHTTITKVVLLLGLSKYIKPFLLNPGAYPSILASSLYTIKQLESQFRDEQEKIKKKT
jgi:ankyrin repeat protein